MADAPPMFEARDLSRHFDVSRPLLQRMVAREGRRTLRAVDGISFDIPKGRTLSLVGESGCGKSTVARLAVGLYTPTAGSVRFDGRDLGAARASADQRRRMQMIFQDPYASLNPRWRVKHIVAEPIRAFGLVTTKAQEEARVAELLTQVGLSPLDGDKFPHEFSGGQRQRISIARALSSNPEFLVCDEPTSALDVSVQAQILNLMKELQQRLGLTFLFISHNLAVVRQVSDRIGVMYLGRLAELAPAESLFRRPRHPYTRALMEAIPDLDMTGRERIPVGGEVPSPITPPSGCAFHPRCPLANDRCKRERPEMKPAGDAMVACHAVEEGRDDAMPMPAIVRDAA
ncbi:ABC transporter ATP-binding protein [Neoroseomonas rubea]|uniref:ABC transporter ATP-binding protein n=1 Tax=Neoroseomonas rubea TaxID=2748666 RepID=UPI0018DF200F|nr:oligopeptide/dipeptide ABC transporter ATP-binding protein [Roseomonas rubea]